MPCYIRLMTMLDLGPERPGPASETRQMGEQGRRAATEQAHVSGRSFWIALLVIAVAIAVFALVLR